MKTCIMAVMLATLAGRAAAQPVQWRVEDGGNGHWYQGINLASAQTLDTAQAHARSRGGHVASVNSAAESAFIGSIALNEALWTSFYVGPIIGMFVDGESCLQGCWITGEPVTFTNWWPGNPDQPAIDRCVYLFARTTQWQNHPCGQRFRDSYPESYIIEWSADCNNDGIVDKGQILSGQLPDANNNGIPDGGPTITAQPVDQNVGVDSPVTFIVEVASDPSCTTPVTFQWQRRNPTVADPTAASAWIDLVDGGGLFGTRAPNLSISRPIPGLATGYRCKIGGGCGCEPGQGGFVYTNTVNFSVACPADFNADGGVDGLDLFAFFERWENGC